MDQKINKFNVFSNKFTINLQEIINSCYESNNFKWIKKCVEKIRSNKFLQQIEGLNWYSEISRIINESSLIYVEIGDYLFSTLGNEWLSMNKNTLIFQDILIMTLSRKFIGKHAYESLLADYLNHTRELYIQFCKNQLKKILKNKEMNIYSLYDIYSNANVPIKDKKIYIFLSLRTCYMIEKLKIKIKKED